MRIAFTESAWEDYAYIQVHQADLARKINRLIREVIRSPFSGIGKVEPLRGDLAGFWSRRINHEHRLVYKVEAELVVIVSCRYHY